MGRFLFGFAIGVAIGALAVIFAAPRSGAETLHGIRALIDDAIAAGKQASATHQQEMWVQFRSRIEKKDV
jgi:gas vesicle protein